MNARPRRDRRRSAANEEASGLTQDRDRLLERLQLRFECMPLGCIVSDPDFTIRDWNPAATVIFGYTKDEAVGKSGYGLIVPQPCKPAMDGVLAEVAAHRRSVTRTGEGLTRDGRTITCEWQHAPLIDAAGQSSGLLAVVQDVTRRFELETLRERLAAVVEQAGESVVITDLDGRIVYVNSYFESFTGYTRAEVIGQNPRILKSGFQDRAFYGNLWQTITAGQVWSGRFSNRRKDGSLYHEDETIFPIKSGSGKITHYAAVRKDVTKRVAQERRAERLARLYTTLSLTNEAIVRATEAAGLYNTICQIAIKSGGLLGAWVGQPDPATRHIVAITKTDSLNAYLDAIFVSMDADVPEGCGPAGTALRENRAFVANQFLVNFATAPWRSAAERFGIRAAATFPLRCRGEPVGVLTLYSDQEDFFDDEIVQLLEEMAADVSYALDNFERERDRKQAETALRESEYKFRSLVEQSIAGVYIIVDGRFAYVNPRLAEIFGRAPSEIIGTELLGHVVDGDRPVVARLIDDLISARIGNIQYNFGGRRSDGSTVDIDAHATRSAFEGKPAVIGMLQDITERRRAQEQIQRQLAQLEESMFHTVEAVSTMVEQRDPYTSGHERRVGEFAAAIGAELGLSEAEVKGLRITGYVHDIGKIGVPAEILSKPSRLTPAETEIIKAHVQLGYDILKSVEFPWPVAQTILQHHERIDGSGYPNGVKGDDIILAARILAVADTVEGMASHRPYRPGRGLDAALKEIEKQSGKHYDSQVVAACLRLFREKNYRLPD